MKVQLILQVEIPQLTFVASRVKLVIYNIARKGVVVCRLGESFCWNYSHIQMLTETLWLDVF